jgi:predicted AlkP superfamily phosphohydrolase/phosphomutase
MVIGLDGLTLKVLLPMVEAGALPTFARLLGSGAWGVLCSVTNMTTGPTWASFATGCHPRKHGVLHDFHHQPDAYALRPTNGSDCQMHPFWRVASDTGLTSIVLNVPMTYPAQPLRGVLLAGVDAPREGAPGFDYPPGTYRRLKADIGDYIIDCGLASYMQSGQLAAGVAAVEGETESHTRAAEYFMQQMRWDLLVIVYSLPDVWEHYYWHALERRPDRNGREMIQDGYRLVDLHLSRLLKHLPDDGCVILCSDHGFGPVCGTRDHLNSWLAQQGWLEYRQTGQRIIPARFVATLLAQVRRHVSMRRRQQLLASLAPLRRVVETQLRIGNIDWTKTKVYAAVDYHELWVNLSGRQPAGCVLPADYEPLCESLSARLLSWHDAQSGLRRINAVTHRPYGDVSVQDNSPSSTQTCLPPDLLLDWNEDAAPDGLHPLVSGEHAPDGTLIVAGEGVRPQHLEECSLVDVAPLALHALGLNVPAGMDGHIPHSVLSAQY